jgi:hypothetical protein
LEPDSAVITSSITLVVAGITALSAVSNVTEPAGSS